MNTLMWTLFANLFFAHLLADFPLQRNKWVANKRERGLCGAGLYKHIVVVFVVTWLASGCLDFIWWALVIAIVHGIIDYLKARKTAFGFRAFALDQLCHAAILYVVVRYGYNVVEWHQLSAIPEGKELLYPSVACAYVFCVFASNYWIQEILKFCKIQDGLKNGSDGFNSDGTRISGALIGSLERILILTFILMGNYEAAGLTVAAKTILRFKDSEGPRTEYVLIGTLLSFVIALVCAAVILMCVVGLDLIKTS